MPSRRGSQSASTPLITRRIADFEALMAAGEDKAAINAAMRQLSRRSPRSKTAGCCGWNGRAAVRVV